MGCFGYVTDSALIFSYAQLTYQVPCANVKQSQAEFQSYYLLSIRLDAATKGLDTLIMLGEW